MTKKLCGAKKIIDLSMDTFIGGWSGPYLFVFRCDKKDGHKGKHRQSRQFYHSVFKWDKKGIYYDALAD